MTSSKKPSTRRKEDHQVSTRAQIERLYRIVAMVQNNEANNLTDLAMAYEVNTRTIQRDIEFPIPNSSPPRLTGGALRSRDVGMDAQKLIEERIWIDPARCFGKPCIRGHRIWVSLILDLLANGDSVQEILECYPDICPEDIQACIAYGAAMSRERFVRVPLEPVAA